MNVDQTNEQLLKSLADLPVPPKAAKRAAKRRPDAVQRLAAIPDRSPREYYDALEKLGYVGQEAARRSLCLMAYRHVQRLKDRYLRGVQERQLTPKSAVLMLGPTGCGKTYLANLLFGQLIGLPVAIEDMTAFTETGYVGRSVPEILGDLILAAGGDPLWAAMGVCILDEFDKLAGACNARSAGRGTTKDVSGFGVQRELLCLIAGGDHPAGVVGQRVRTGPRPTLRTDDVGFIACGAFSGIKEIAVRQRGEEFGLASARTPVNTSAIAYELEHRDIASVEVFQRYGFLPELIGRFTGIVRLAPLGRNELKQILMLNVMPRFQAEFQREGFRLQVEDTVLNDIVTQAEQRQTGARGLTLQLTQYLDEQAFERFGTNRRVRFGKAG